MKRKFVPVTSSKAFRSDEFRAFAIKWLGFDPDDVSSPKRCEVYFDFSQGGMAEYYLEARASAKPAKEESAPPGIKWNCILAVAGAPNTRGFVFTEEALQKAASQDPNLFYDPDRKTLYGSANA